MTECCTRGCSLTTESQQCLRRFLSHPSCNYFCIHHTETMFMFQCLVMPLFLSPSRTFQQPSGAFPGISPLCQNSGPNIGRSSHYWVPASNRSRRRQCKPLFLSHLFNKEEHFETSTFKTLRYILAWPFRLFLIDSIACLSTDHLNVSLTNKS